MASTSPATTPSPLSPAELQGLVARAGLALNPGQFADLVLVWRQMAGLLAMLPRDRAFLDDQAYVFRLPPPAAKPAVKPAKPEAAKPKVAKPKVAKPKVAKPKAAKPKPANPKRAGSRARTGR